MCVLTLVGNVLVIVANLFKVGLLEAGNRNGGIGTDAYYYLSLALNANMLSCIGAMLGAAFMLKGKLLGYKIYALSMGLHAIIAVCAMVLWAMTIYLIGISVLIAIYFIIPALFFLFFRNNQKQLS